MDQCYAHKLGECSEQLSREHVISKVLLPNKVGISGLEWCIDEEVFIGKNSFVVKNLCRKHNSDLSPYDIAMQQFFNKLDLIRNSKKSIKLKLDGKNIERWILKTAINLRHFYEKDDIDFDYDVVLPYLFGNKKFQYPFGLAIAFSPIVKAPSGGKLLFKTRFSPNGNKNIIDSIIMIYKAIPFIIELDTLKNKKNINSLSIKYSEEYQSINMMQYVWHPRKINTDNYVINSKINIIW